jgi:hypothetical protein
MAAGHTARQRQKPVAVADHRVEDRHVERNEREGVSADDRADVVEDGGLDAAGVDEITKVQKRSDQDVKCMGGQGRFDHVGRLFRALAQDASQHPEQYMGVGDDRGHRSTSPPTSRSAASVAGTTTTVLPSGCFSVTFATIKGGAERSDGADMCWRSDRGRWRMVCIALPRTLPGNQIWLCNWSSGDSVPNS